MFWLKVILVLNQHLNYFLPRTEKPKIVFLKRHKGATPSFFESHRGTRGYLIPCDESPVYCFQFCYPSLVESALSKTFAQRFPPKPSQSMLLLNLPEQFLMWDLTTNLLPCMSTTVAVTVMPATVATDVCFWRLFLTVVWPAGILDTFLEEEGGWSITVEQVEARLRVSDDDKVEG